MIKRPCGVMGCGRLVEKGVRYCDRHQTPASRGIVPGRREGKDATAYAKAHETPADKSAKSWARFNANVPGSEWYGTTRWRKLRAAHIAEHPLCVHCGNPGSHADHIQSHRGNEELFFLAENLQTLCRSCHAKKTAATRRFAGGDVPLGALDD